MPQVSGGAGGSEKKKPAPTSGRRDYLGVGDRAGGGGATGGRTQSSPPSPSPNTYQQEKTPTYDHAIHQAQKVYGMTDAPGAPGESKKLQKIRDMYGYAPQTDRYKYSKDFLAKLDDVETQSGGLMPTDATIAMAQLQLLESDRRKYARMISNNLKTPAKEVLSLIGSGKGNIKDWDYTDPVTGEKISFETAKRYYPALEAYYWKNVLTNTPGGYQQDGDPKKYAVDPKWVAASIAAIRPNVGLDMNFKQTIGVAITMAQHQVNTGLLSENLKYLNTRVDLKSIDKVAVAHMAATVGEKINDDASLNTFIALAKGPQEVQDAVLQAMDMKGSVEGLKQEYADSPAAQSVLDQIQERMDSGQVIDQMWLDDMFSQARLQAQDVEYGTTVDQLDAEQRALDELRDTVGGYVGASNSATAFATKFMASGDKVKSAKVEYDKNIQEILDQVKAEEQSQYDAEHSTIGKIKRNVGHYVGSAYANFQQVFETGYVSYVNNVYGPEVASLYSMLGANDNPRSLFGPGFTGDPAQDARRQAEWTDDILHGRRHLTEWLQEEHGYSGIEAGLIDLAVTWYADPLLIGGKMVHGAKLAKFALGASNLRTFTDSAIKVVTSKRFASLGFKTILDKQVGEAFKAADAIGDTRRTAKLLAENTDSAGKTIIGVEARTGSRGTKMAGLAKLVHGGDIPIAHLSEAEFKALYKRVGEVVAKQGDNVSPEVRDLFEKLQGKGVIKNAAKDPEVLYQEHLLSVEGPANAHYQTIDQAIKSRWKGQGIPEEFNNWVFNYVKQWKDIRARSQIKDDIAEAWAVMYGGKQAADSNIGGFLREMEQLGLKKPVGIVDTSAEKVSRLVNDSNDIVASKLLNDLEDMTRSGRGLDYALSVKKSAMLREFGIKGGLEDTRVMRALSALPQKYAGPWLDIEKDFAKSVGSYLGRSREFTKGEMAAYRRQALAIADHSNPTRVQDFRDFTINLQKEIIRREAKHAGLDPDLGEKILDDMMNRVGARNEVAFSAGNDLEEAAINKLFETQDLNRLFVIDPVEVRSRLHEVQNSLDLAVGMARKAIPGSKLRDAKALIKGAEIGKDGKLVMKGADKAAHKYISDVLEGALGDTWMKVWKPLVVVSPRYVMRLVGVEETSRFIADVGLLGRISASKTWAKTANALGLPDREFRYVLDGARSKNVIDDVLKNGFQDVQEALDVVKRSKLRGAIPDPRLDKLSQQTKDILLSTRSYSAPNELTGSKVADVLYDGEDVGGDMLGAVHTPSKSGNRKLNVQNPISSAGTVSAKDLEALKQMDAHFGEGLSWSYDKATDVWTSQGNKITWKDTINQLMKDRKDVEVRQMLSDLGYDGVQAGDAMVVFSQNQVIKIGEHSFEVSLPLPRPGEVIDDLAANAGIGRSEYIESWARQVKLADNELKKVQQAWGPVTVDDPGFYTTWTNNLNNQYGRSVPGRKILQAIYTGEDEAWTVQHMMGWFKNDKNGRLYAERLGLDVKNSGKLEQQVSARVREVWKDTMGDQAIAGNAINHQVTESWLKNTFDNPDALPIVHGLNASKIGDPSKFETVSRAWDWTYKHIMEIPTDRFVRQPYFKHWYTKMRENLLNLAKQQGKTITPELVNSIEGHSRVFAANRVKDVMFDFRESNRFSEMMRFVAPFMMPFTEQYSVWGRLLLDNPAIAAYYKKIWDTGKATGVIKQDPLTGDEQVNLPFVGHLLNGLFPEGTDSAGWSVVGNIASLNFFTQNMLDVGGVSIPMPGLAPTATWALQKAAESGLFPKSMQLKTMDWANQYGKMKWDDALPAWGKDFLTAFGVINDDVKSSVTKEFLKTYYVNGLTPEVVMENGWATTRDEAKAWLVNKAETDSMQLLAFRGVARMFLPIAPQFAPPINSYIDQYRELLQTNDPDKAKKLFEQANPDLASQSILALVQAETYWAGQKDKMVGMEAGPVALPANRLTTMLMNSEGFQTEMKNNPLFAFMFLPDEVWTSEFDTQSYYEQLDKGWRNNITPFDFLDSIDDQQYAEARSLLTDQYLKDTNRLYGKVSTNSSTWKTMSQGYHSDIEALNLQYPGAEARFTRMETLGLDPHQIDLIKAEVLSNPAVMATDMGRATKEFIDGADKIIKKMENNNVYGSDDSQMTDLGIWDDINALKEGIIADHPNFARVGNVLFGNYFSSERVTTKLERLTEKFGDNADIQARTEQFDRAYNKQFSEAITASDKDNAAQHYLALRSLSYTSYRQRGFSPQTAWWNYTLTQPEKEKITAETRIRPFSFLSEFDKREVLNVETSKKTEKLWLRVGEMDAKIGHIRDNNPNADTAHLYELRDKLIKENMKKDSLFKQQVENANAWGYTFFNENPWMEGNDRSQEAWRIFQKSLGNMQHVADQLNTTGMHDFDPNNQAIYQQIRNEIEAKADELSQYSPKFERQWNYMSGVYGGKLAEYFIPEWYFPLGGSRHPLGGGQ